MLQNKSLSLLLITLAFCAGGVWNYVYSSSQLEGRLDAEAFPGVHKPSRDLILPGAGDASAPDPRTSSTSDAHHAIHISPGQPTTAPTVGDLYVELLDTWVDLAQDPNQTDFKGLWDGPDMFYYEDGSRIPAQARRHCKSLFMAASAISADGVAVEFGPWCGHASRCLGAGLRSAGLEGRLFAYDEFKDPQNKDPALSKLKGTRYEAHPDADRFRFIWEETVLPVYPSATAVGGRLAAATFAPQQWGAARHVDVFVIDTAKTHQQWLQQAALVWPHLRVGSILCLMNFVKTPQVEMIYSQYVEPGDLEPVYVDFCASPWVFVVRATPDWSKSVAFDVRQHGLQEWKALFQLVYADVEYMSHKFNVQDTQAIDCVNGHVRNRWEVVHNAIQNGASWS